MTVNSDHGLESSSLEKAGENNNHTVSISPACTFRQPYVLFSRKMVRMNSLNFLICRYFAPAYRSKTTILH